MPNAQVGKTKGSACDNIIDKDGHGHHCTWCAWVSSTQLAQVAWPPNHGLVENRERERGRKGEREGQREREGERAWKREMEMEREGERERERERAWKRKMERERRGMLTAAAVSPALSSSLQLSLVGLQQTKSRLLKLCLHNIKQTRHKLITKYIHCRTELTYHSIYCT